MADTRVRGVWQKVGGAWEVNVFGPKKMVGRATKSHAFGVRRIWLPSHGLTQVSVNITPIGRFD